MPCMKINVAKKKTPKQRFRVLLLSQTTNELQSLVSKHYGSESFQIEYVLKLYLNFG